MTPVERNLRHAVVEIDLLKADLNGEELCARIVRDATSNLFMGAHRKKFCVKHSSRLEEKYPKKVILHFSFESSQLLYVLESRLFCFCFFCFSWNLCHCSRANPGMSSLTSDLFMDLS